MNDSTATEKPPLDEVMLAMDVVDTLRHRERVVERALSADVRDQELILRLKEIYAGQGIEVSDAIIERGVRDLRADRFEYTPAEPSIGRALAQIYVSRSTWGRPVGFGVVIVVVLAIAYQTFVRGPALRAIDALPTTLDQAYVAVTDLASESSVDLQAQTIRNSGELALADGDFDAVRTAIAELETLYDELARVYEVRVRSAPGELSGIWRVPDANPNAQNFYLIVEAVDPDGTRLRVPIRNEENDSVRVVARWGQRVDEATFRATAADKQDDGVIQNAVIGEKKRGVLTPEFTTGVQPGAITDW